MDWSGNIFKEKAFEEISEKRGGGNAEPIGPSTQESIGLQKRRLKFSSLKLHLLILWLDRCCSLWLNRRNS